MPVLGSVRSLALGDETVPSIVLTCTRLHGAPIEITMRSDHSLFSEGDGNAKLLPQVWAAFFQSWIVKLGRIGWFGVLELTL